VYAITILRFKFLEILPAGTASFIRKLPQGFLLWMPEQNRQMESGSRKAPGTRPGSPLYRQLAQVWPDLEKVTGRAEGALAH
jgi:hypothetical protein